MLFLVYLLGFVFCQQVFDVPYSSQGLADYYVNDQSLLEFHRGLIEIDSIAPHEAEVAYFLSDFLKSRGLTVELHESAKGRYNVYAYTGQRNNKIVLTSHIDTVPPYIPYSVEGSKIYGRGSCDAKASVAAQVFSYLDLVETNTIESGDVALLFVVGEEVDGSGMQAASEKLNTTWEVGIFGEPTELKLGVGHKGVLMLLIEIIGKASHSGYPELGISANEILIPLLNDFLNLDLPHNDLLGPTTLNIGKINAGVAANVIPASANATLFFRVAEDLEGLKKTVQEKLDSTEHLSYSIIAHSEPQYLDFKVPGCESIVLAYATDVPNLHQNLTARFLYGPGTIHVAHSANEFVESQDLVDAVSGYKRLIEYSLSRY